jgi:5-methylcytosine-specific restriction enzyme subunit McrC
MPEVISIVEHQTLPIVTKREEGVCAITHTEAKKLAGMKSLPAGAFSWQHNALKWSQFCGVVRIGELMLEILPKIHGKEEDPGSCRTALVRMLKTAGFMKLNKVGAASIRVQNHTILDVFIQDLCDRVDKELLQGKIRKYRTREENLPVLRGKLLSDYQLRHNLAHRERLYCQFDELSEDILVNQTIKFTLRTLLSLAQRRVVKNGIYKLLYAFDKVSDISLEEARSSTVQFNRAEERYAGIYRTCMQFLQSLYQDVATGAELSFSLMFDMNRLFESWVASVLKPTAHKFDLLLREQGPRRYLVYREDIDRELFQLRPDISLLNSEGHAVVIADAKWKLLDKSESKLGISQSDLYQMQAYASRYGIKQLLLLYPAQVGLKGIYDMDYLLAEKVHLRVLTIDIDNPDMMAKGFGPILAQ